MSTLPCTASDCSVNPPAAVDARMRAVAPGLLLLVMACVWLPLALLEEDTVSVPGVVSATSSALTVMPLPAPTASTPAECVSPAPASADRFCQAATVPAPVPTNWYVDPGVMPTVSAPTVMSVPAPTSSTPEEYVKP